MTLIVNHVAACRNDKLELRCLQRTGGGATGSTANTQELSPPFFIGTPTQIGKLPPPKDAFSAGRAAEEDNERRRSIGSGNARGIT